MGGIWFAVKGMYLLGVAAFFLAIIINAMFGFIGIILLGILKGFIFNYFYIKDLENNGYILKQQY